MEINLKKKKKKNPVEGPVLIKFSPHSNKDILKKYYEFWDDVCWSKT